MAKQSSKNKAQNTNNILTGLCKFKLSDMIQIYYPEKECDAVTVKVWKDSMLNKSGGIVIISAPNGIGKGADMVAAMRQQPETNWQNID